MYRKCHLCISAFWERRETNWKYNSSFPLTNCSHTKTAEYAIPQTPQAFSGLQPSTILSSQNHFWINDTTTCLASKQERNQTRISQTAHKPNLSIKRPHNNGNFLFSQDLKINNKHKSR